MRDSFRAQGVPVRADATASRPEQDGSEVSEVNYGGANYSGANYGGAS